MEDQKCKKVIIGVKIEGLIEMEEFGDDLSFMKSIATFCSIAHPWTEWTEFNTEAVYYIDEEGNKIYFSDDNKEEEGGD